MPEKCILIAEAGVNHNGDMAIARELIAAAARAGADYVKFQTFHAKSMAASGAAMADYQIEAAPAAKDQLEMLQNLELPDEAFFELEDYAKKTGIGFLSSPFDLAAIRLLAKMKLPVIKAPSGEINNLPYLRELAAHDWDIILSTGMSRMDEIAAALAVLQEHGKNPDRVTLLHCTSQYPAPIDEVNLLAIPYMAEHFPQCRGIGFSDHTEGIEAAFAAAALGAQVIEKHFTLDKSMPGPDHKASISPAELQNLASGIDKIVRARGQASKFIAASEQKNRLLARKSIVAARDIEKGEIFDEENLAVKRPGTGISPMQWDKIIGRRSAGGIRADALLRREDIA